MEPLLIILIPGIIGGLVIAGLIASKRIDLRGTGVGRGLEPPSPSLINMAHIRVEGGGGLGIVAAVVAVALADPRIRLVIGVAALFGVALAWALIAWHRREMDAGGGDSGPHSMLGLEEPVHESDRTGPEGPVRASVMKMPAWNPR